MTGASCNSGNIGIKFQCSMFTFTNVVEQLDKLPFHLKIVEEMCNY